MKNNSLYKAMAAFWASAIVLITGINPFCGHAVGTDGAQNPLCLPILMYHEVKYESPGKDSIQPYELEGDLQYLQSAGYHTITMKQLIDYVYSGAPLPEKPIILSFDDGYLSTYVYARPLLKKYKARIVLSIIGKSTDDFSQKPSDDITTHMTWAQLKELQDAGLVEIQNHTYNMHKITRRRYGCSKKQGETKEDYVCALTEDITRMQADVQRHMGMTPTTFTYPYGQVCEDSFPVIKSLGFKAALTCKYGINLITKDPEVLYDLRRICRAHGVTAKKSLDEAMKTLRFRKGYHVEKEADKT